MSDDREYGALLDQQVVLDALASEFAANGIASHHTMSMDRYVEQYLPNIIMEVPEIVSESKNAIHITEFVHVQEDRPVAKTSGGFFDRMDPQSAMMTRHTYATPLVIDVVHRVYSNAPVSREVAWEVVNPDAVANEIREIAKSRDGKPAITAPTSA